MTIAISQWAATDQTVRAQLDELKPLCEAKGCVGLSRLCLTQDRASIQQRLDKLFPVPDEDAECFFHHAAEITAYIDCGRGDRQVVVVFLPIEDGDAVLVYPATSESAVDISHDN